ncbi:hypothetical protein TNCV_373961 [Trichonephila clavipes]|nr:hypothetical protein TNCV_373961 [Trichonephila clavipes]
MPTTSGYNLRPQIGKREESRPSIERKAQGSPVRSRKGRERNDSPYIEERTRSSNKNARRGGGQPTAEPGKERNVDEEILVTGGLGRKRQLQVIRTSSYDNPTPLAHADASRDVFPRGGTSHLTPSFSLQVRSCVVFGGEDEKE